MRASAPAALSWAAVAVSRLRLRVGELSVGVVERCGRLVAARLRRIHGAPRPLELTARILL